MKRLAKTVSALLLLAPISFGAYAAENQTSSAMPGMQHGQSGQGMGGMGGMMNMQKGQGNTGMGMQHGQGQQGGMQGMGGGGMGMMGMMGNMSDEQMDQHLRMMQEHILQMHDLSDKILAATDPAEKEKLKAQQRDLMKAHKKQMMQMMHGGMNMGQKDPGQKPGTAPQQDIQHQKHSDM